MDLTKHLIILAFYTVLSQATSTAKYVEKVHLNSTPDQSVTPQLKITKLLYKTMIINLNEATPTSNTEKISTNQNVTESSDIQTTKLLTTSSSEPIIKQTVLTTQIPSSTKSGLTTPELIAIITGAILGISILVGGLLSLSRHLINRREIARNLLT